MSNSISALVQRGWARRTSPVRDRRVVVIEVTATGRAALERVGRCAEAHLADVLRPLHAPAGRRLRGGLSVLQDVFSGAPTAQNGAARKPRSGRR
jgi:DNA-binding MarR family transcriptional regulator